MRRAEGYQKAPLTGYLTETEVKFQFEYVAGYKDRPASLTMPVRAAPYEFDKFPPFFEGLLPEGRQRRCFGQKFSGGRFKTCCRYLADARLYTESRALGEYPSAASSLASPALRWCPPF
jgi:HipA-like protein